MKETNILKLINFLLGKSIDLQKNSMKMSGVFILIVQNEKKKTKFGTK